MKVQTDGMVSPVKRTFADRLLGRGRTDAAVDAILKDVSQKASADTSQPARWGRWALVLGMAFFVAWGALAPLSQGVPVSGFVKVEGESKVVQHQKGGIVEDIPVKEGDRVTAGQVLLRLNEVQYRAQVGTLEAQLVSTMAVDARLKAERAKEATIAYPSFLTTRNQPDAQAAMRLQTDLFTSRRTAIRIEEAATRAAISGLEEQIKGYMAQQAARTEQLRIYQAEFDNLKPMYEQGFVPRNRIYELERTLSMLVGQRSEDVANIGKAQSAIAEAKHRIDLALENYRKEVETQLTESSKQVADLQQRLLGFRDDLDRLIVTSPIDGIVTGLNFHTRGGVVAPGQRLMDIVPIGLPLVIEVMIPPHLIDNVRPGLEADVNFQALDRSVVPTVAGRLVYVAADKQSEPNRPDINYFIGRVTVDAGEMVKLGSAVVKVCKPADALIKTGERTFFGYLAKPLLVRLQSSFKER